MLAMFLSFPAHFLCMHGEGSRIYIFRCMRHSCYGCRKANSPALQNSGQLKAPYSDGYTKTEKCAVYAAREWCRGQYIGGVLLSRETDASATTGWGDRPCLTWTQGSCTKARPTAAETTVICFTKQEPSPHKPQARDSMTCDRSMGCFLLAGS